jgi:hypothetical protein
MVAGCLREGVRGRAAAMGGREYEYQLKVGRTQTRAAVWGAAAIGFAWMALTNGRGLVLFIIPLSEHQATIFYGLFAGLAAMLAVIDTVNVVRRGSLRQRIAFADTGMIVPKSPWTAEEMTIAYADVIDITSFNEPDSVVVLRHRDGEFTLRLDLLPDERAYGEIVQQLTIRIQMAKAGSAGPA